MTEKDTKKTYIITGATSGIGLAIMEGLAEKRHDLIGIGRSPERCKIQSERLHNMFPTIKIEYLVADLSNQGDICRAVGDIDRVIADWRKDGLDGLINNAGTFIYWQTLTEDGFETQWAVNHLAPFLLTNLLLPQLIKKTNARVITVSSGSHYSARLNWEDLQGTERYNPLRAYKQSKLANVLFTVELNRRLGAGSPVRAFAADPGLVNTGIGEKTHSWIAKKIWGRRRKKGIPAAQSAAGIIHLLDENLENQEAPYWKHGEAKKPNPFALDDDHGWRLWEISAQMTGVK